MFLILSQLYFSNAVTLNCLGLYYLTQHSVAGFEFANVQSFIKNILCYFTTIYSLLDIVTSLFLYISVGFHVCYETDTTTMQADIFEPYSPATVYAGDQLAPNCNT